MEDDEKGNNDQPSISGINKWLLRNAMPPKTSKEH